MTVGSFLDGWNDPDGDALYTDEIKTLFKLCKEHLPVDYTLATRTEGPYIFIIIPRNQFDYRAVEDKARIAVTLERLKNLVRGTGINCEIETVPSLTPFG